MKITKSQVKQIIKEELSILVEAEYPPDEYKREIFDLAQALKKKLGGSALTIEDRIETFIITSFFPESKVAKALQKPATPTTAPAKITATTEPEVPAHGPSPLDWVLEPEKHKDAEKAWRARHGDF
tara:strand:+ start:339 stop:716 length:378 start_codon:yes stop_codon:yes gene_type:complete